MKHDVLKHVLPYRCRICGVQERMLTLECPGYLDAKDVAAVESGDVEFVHGKWFHSIPKDGARFNVRGVRAKPLQLMSHRSINDILDRLEALEEKA